MISRVRRLIAALPPPRRVELVWTLVLMGLSALADAAAIVTLANGIATIAAGTAATAEILRFIVLITLSGLLRLATVYATQRLGNLASRDLVVRAHRNWLDQPYSFHQQRHSGQLLASPERVDQAVFGLLLPSLQGVAAMLSLMAILAALITVDAGAAIAMVSLLILGFFAAALAIRRALARHAEQANRAYERRIKVLQESHSGVRDIILDQSQPQRDRQLTGAANALARSGIATAVASALPRQLIETGGIVAIVLLTLFLADRPAGLAAALPTLGALALAGQRLLPAVQQLFQGWATATAAAPMVDEALALAELPLPIVAAVDPPAFTRSIELKAVGFTYPGQVSPAIDTISLAINKGQRLIVTGPSGAGKSTLADLIMGLQAPGHGLIAVDGVACTPVELQRLVSHVPQSPFFADHTLAEAVAGDDEPDTKRLKQAIEAAGLPGLVARLDRGLDTVIGEHGVNLSGGERQRIALARAIYRRAPLLILDEATSAVDEEAERHILDSLDQLQANGKTIIIIAHRGGALARAGTHIGIENGRLVGGSFELTPGLEHQH